MDQATDTCLSSKVKLFYDVAKENNSYVDYDVLSDDLILIFDNIFQNFPSEKSDYEVVLKLIPTLATVHKKFHELIHKSVNTEDIFVQNTQWTSQPGHLRHCLDLVREGEERSLECVLVLTPVLERSLADLLLSAAPGPGTKPPSLLRDLLQLPALEQLLGAACVRLLQLLLGSPRTLNLRNIAWHGFAFPGEVSAMFVSVLLAVFTSIGAKLRESPLTIERHFVSNWKVTSLNTLHNCQPLKIFSLQEMEAMANGSNLFFSQNLPQVRRIYCYMSEGHFGAASILILPLLETMMRRLFVLENKCPQRMMTAENDQLYTTFTEIFSQNLGEGVVNRFVETVGEPFLELMFDLFVLPDGPRLRDKLGHGELDLDLLNKTSSEHYEDTKTIANNLMAVLVILLQKTQNFSQSDYFSLFYGDYKAKFHPSSKLIKNMLKILVDLDEVKNYTLSEDCEVSESSDSLSNSPEELHDALMLHTCKTLFRPREEYEILQILLQITEAVLLSIQNMSANVEEKLCLLRKKELRSRQRVTLQRMINNLPKLKSVFLSLTRVMFQLFAKIEEVSKYEIYLRNLKVTRDGKVRSFLRHLKVTLKITENISSNVSSQKNRWDEVEKLIVNLNDNLNIVENLLINS